MWRSWNLAASEDYLWQLQYASVFCNSDKCLKRKGHQSSRPDEDQESILLQEDMATRSGIDWREAFKRAYLGIWIQILLNLLYVLWMDKLHLDTRAILIGLWIINMNNMYLDHHFSFPSLQKLPGEMAYPQRFCHYHYFASILFSICSCSFQSYNELFAL